MRPCLCVVRSVEALERSRGRRAPWRLRSSDGIPRAVCRRWGLLEVDRRVLRMPRSDRDTSNRESDSAVHFGEQLICFEVDPFGALTVLLPVRSGGANGGGLGDASCFAAVLRKIPGRPGLTVSRRACESANGSEWIWEDRRRDELQEGKHPVQCLRTSSSTGSRDNGAGELPRVLLGAAAPSRAVASKRRQI